MGRTGGRSGRRTGKRRSRLNSVQSRGTGGVPGASFPGSFVGPAGGNGRRSLRCSTWNTVGIRCFPRNLLSAAAGWAALFLGGNSGLLSADGSAEPLLFCLTEEDFLRRQASLPCLDSVLLPPFPDPGYILPLSGKKFHVERIRRSGDGSFLSLPSVCFGLRNRLPDG